MTDTQRQKIQLPEIINELVGRFGEQHNAYHSGKYNETQLRRDFLDPFFEALGWDVSNKKNYSEKFREVLHEVSVEVEGQAKAADYAFQSGGGPLFFIEAKKPAVNIENDTSAAFQIRRYAWSAKLPVSILTNFEQLSIYDCRSKPVHGDPAHIGRTHLFSYREYITRWDELWNLISYEAVHQGSLEKLIQSSKGRKGTADVDDDFLAEMERWRKELALNIALRNPSLTTRQINTSVQLTIDRIIFLRICEDRKIEPEENLRNATDGIDVYGDMMALFATADKKYNSGLFHFSTEKGRQGYSDTLTPNIKVDDRVIKDILANLYLPKSPYAFNYFSADVLGHVYERFLGKVIRLTPAHQAKVEEKPEVRKAGGVFYTPTYIVNYIVENTVGELLKDKTPESLNTTPLRVLDPACGSGSFLIGAYQYLLDWYLDWYIKNEPAKWAKGAHPTIFENFGNWKLTIEQRKLILTRHIYGVDIDPQAVEVTKLSLLLKVVEAPGQASFFGERILPDLDDNIKCGNSLIGSDFYSGQQMGMFDSEEQYRVNAFDWQTAFPNVFGKGGFDSVIGNPPYGASFNEKTKNYLANKYPDVSDYESSQYFLLRAKFYTRNLGIVGFIVPNTIFLNNFAKNFRGNISRNFKILSLINLSNVDVFETATVRTVIPFLVNSLSPNPKIEISYFEQFGIEPRKKIVDQNDLINKDNEWINALTSSRNQLIEKISRSTIPLGQILAVSQGLIPYDKYRGHSEYTIKNRIWNSDHKKNDTYKRELRGGDVTRYSVNWNGKQWISYGPWLAAPRKPEFFIKPRLLFREITDPKTGLLHVGLTEEEFYNNPGIINCINSGSNYSLYYLLGIVDSKLLAYFHFNSSPKANKGVFPKILVNDVRNLPIRAIDFTNVADVSLHDRMIALVRQMLTLHEQFASAKLPDEKERLQRQINGTDRRIDNLVYKLYGLSVEEIRIIEEG